MPTNAFIIDQQNTEGARGSGFGDIGNGRDYIFQGFTPTKDNIAAIGFRINEKSIDPNQGYKVWIDEATEDFYPVNAVGGIGGVTLISNSQLTVGELQKYNLTSPVSLIPDQKYVIAFAPWNTDTDTYSTDYRDFMISIDDPYSGGIMTRANTGYTDFNTPDSGDADLVFRTYAIEPVPTSFNIPVNNNPEYQIVVKDKEMNVIGEFTQWKNLKYGDKLNDYGEASFDVPVTSPELQTLLAQRVYDIYIVRNGAVVWAGEEANTNTTLNTDDPNLFTVSCLTFIEQWNQRLTPIDVRYESTDQGQILKALVDDSQDLPDGDFGATFADIEPTMPRDREYFSEYILQAFINMSNDINGIDFWEDVDKVIHIVPYRGIDQSSQYVFEFGVNLITPQITGDFSSPANSVRALGAGFGVAQTIAEYTDTTARGVYKLRQQKISEIDVSEVATLTDKAANVVRTRGTLLTTVTINQVPNTAPTFGSVGLGDSVTTRAKKGVININNVFRIYGYQVTIGETGEENIAYTISQK